MDITRRSDYACRLLRAAYEAHGAVVSVADVSGESDIPYAFARSIQHDLVKSGLLRTVRGAKGGFALACDPRGTTLLDVVRAIQGPVSVAPCAGFEGECPFNDECAFHELWLGVDVVVDAYLGAITLQDLLELGRDHPAVRHALAGGGFAELGAAR